MAEPLRHQEWGGCHVQLDDRGDRMVLTVWTGDGLLSTWVQGYDLEVARQRGFGAARLCVCGRWFLDRCCADGEERSARAEALDDLRAELDAEARAERWA